MDNNLSIQNLLDKFDINIDNLLKNPLINSDRLLNEGIIEFKLEDVLNDGYQINELGEIIPPLLTLSGIGDELGYDRKKMSVYNSRGHFPKPSITIKERGFWTYRQVKLITGKEELIPEREQRTGKAQKK